MEKNEIRNEISHKRNSLTAWEVKEKSEKIRYNIENYSSFKNSERVMLYFEKGNEVEVSPLTKTKKIVFLPKIVKNDIVPVRFDGLDKLKEGEFGIKEPIGEGSRESIELCLVPGICFDAKGNRIGYGKGFYDRFLSGFKGLKIGVCYDFQMVDELSVKIHDVKMDAVITEEKIYDNRW